MTMRPALSPAIVAAALRLTIDPDGSRGTPAEAGLRLRAHAVEALLMADPALMPEVALRLTGLAGPGAALAVAAEMSGPEWDAGLVQRIARLLRLLAPARGAHCPTAARRAGDITASALGDPSPGRSALDRRAAAA